MLAKANHRWKRLSAALVATAFVLSTVPTHSSNQGVEPPEGLASSMLRPLLSSASYGVYLNGKKIGTAKRTFSEWSSHYELAYRLDVAELENVVTFLRATRSEFDKEPPFLLRRRTLEERTVLKENPFSPVTRHVEMTTEARGLTVTSRETNGTSTTRTVPLAVDFSLGDALAWQRLGIQKPLVGSRFLINEIFDNGTSGHVAHEVTNTDTKSVLGETVSVISVQAVGHSFMKHAEVDELGRLFMIEWPPLQGLLRGKMIERIEEFTPLKSLAERGEGNIELEECPDNDPLCFLDGL